jgi:hypothetical protein
MAVFYLLENKLQPATEMYTTSLSKLGSEKDRRRDA